jgi:hypothetical protein
MATRNGSSARPGRGRTPRPCGEPRARIERGPRSLFSYVRALRLSTIAIAARVGLEHLQKDSLLRIPGGWGKIGNTHIRLAAASENVLTGGPSDYDIGNTFSGAVSYDIPGPGSGVLKQVFGNWSTDSIIYARTDPPVSVVTGLDPFNTGFLAGAFGIARLNLVPGFDESGAPGGKIINAAAFSIPAVGQGDLGRNALRGFGATKFDLTLRRQFRFTERLSRQARADFFNIFNHPNFGNPNNYLDSGPGVPNPLFGQSTQMLASYLGSGGQSGGLNPLYQIGGPRSIQLALKLQF